MNARGRNPWLEPEVPSRGTRGVIGFRRSSSNPYQSPSHRPAPPRRPSTINHRSPILLLTGAFRQPPILQNRRLVKLVLSCSKREWARLKEFSPPAGWDAIAGALAHLGVSTADHHARSVFSTGTRFVLRNTLIDNSRTEGPLCGFRAFLREGPTRNMASGNYPAQKKHRARHINLQRNAFLSRLQ
jgi:hypothetical protein